MRVHLDIYQAFVFDHDLARDDWESYVDPQGYLLHPNEASAFEAVLEEMAEDAEDVNDIPIQRDWILDPLTANSDTHHYTCPKMKGVHIYIVCHRLTVEAFEGVNFYQGQPHRDL